MLDDFSTSGGLLGDDAVASDDQGAIRFRRIRDVGSVINITFRFLGDTWRELGMGLLVIVGPIALLAAMASFLMQSQWVGAMNGLAQPDPSNPFAIFEQFLTPAYFVAILLGLLAPLLVSAATLAYVQLYRDGEAGTVTPGRLWEATRMTLGPVLTTTLVLVGVMILSVLVMIVPCLGVVAWLAFLIYTLPLIALLYIARVQGYGIGDGVQRVRSLVQGQWGPSFGAVVIAMLIVIVFSMVLSIPSSMVSFGWMMNTVSGEPPGAGTRALMAVGAILGTLTYVAYTIPVVASAFLYFSLTEQAESTELHTAIDAIGLTPPPEEPVSDPPLRPMPEDNPAPSWRPSSPETLDKPSGFRGGGFDDGPDEPGRSG